MLKYCAVLTIAGFAVLGGSSLACERHKDEKTSSDLRTVGKIYFQPTRPDHPTNGEVWIDARNGEQFIFQNGVWISRNLRITLSALKSDR